MVSPPFAFRLNIHHLSTSRQVKKFPAGLKGIGDMPDKEERVMTMKGFFKSFCVGCLIGTGLAWVVNRWIETED